MLTSLIISMSIWFGLVVIAIILAKSKYKSGRIFTGTNVMFIATFVAAFVLFVPIYYKEVFSAGCVVERVIKSLLLGIHNTLRLFVIDSDFGIIMDTVASVGMVGVLAMLYTTFAALLFVCAPLLTFDFLLSFFKDLSSYKRYIFSFFRDVYIFSELNDKSLALAKSIMLDKNAKDEVVDENGKIKKKRKIRRTVIFTDVFEKNEEGNFELIEKAKELGAIFFKKDILTVKFNLHSKKRNLTFFTISEKESENVNQSFGIIERYKDRTKPWKCKRCEERKKHKECETCAAREEGKQCETCAVRKKDKKCEECKTSKKNKERASTELYVFSTSVDGELIMAAANKGEVKVRRIKDVRSLIYRTLYDMETKVIAQRKAGVPERDIKPDIFMTAKPMEDGMKQIGAVVVGCGLHGTEMIKALTWFCQMDGYRVSIDVFDRDKNMQSKFTALCPELMSEEYNGVYVHGEAQYLIDFHYGVNKSTGEKIGMDIATAEFAGEIKKLKNTTYVFVALGTDEENIKAAVLLRTLFEQMHVHPIIQAVVYSSEKKEALTGIKNFKNQAYDIEFVGDLNTLYSQEVIIDSALEDAALARHRKYGEEETFWAYEYNYRSSTAAALAVLAREACKIPGADKPEEELTPEEIAIIEPLEHRRWNAYMRSEGYIYSGSKDSKSRNDLGKMHHDLVNFAELSEEEKRKDSRVGSK